MVGDCHGLGLPKKVFKMEKWSKDTFDGGVFLFRSCHVEGMCKFCHVVLRDDVLEAVQKPEVGEQMWLDSIVMNKNKKCVCVLCLICSSRLACQIRVIKEMDGTTVFVVVLYIW